MRKYELIFIVRPDLPEADLDKLITQMDGVVSGAGGKVEKIEKLGRRGLAYRVKKSREGFFVLFRLEGTGDTVKEFERRLKVTDTVIKYMAVRIDEDEKRVEKLKALRAEQASKKHRSKPAAAPSGAGPAAGSALQPAAEPTQG
jgi:small subunit ribosomal protein S6